MIPTDPKYICDFVIKQGNSVSGGLAKLRCASLVNPGERYCPAHSRAWNEKPKSEKHDLDLDVLPWDEKTFNSK